MKKTIYGIVLLILVIFITGCGSKSLVGTWKTEKNGVEYFFIFNEDKTCSYEMTGVRMECTYVDGGTKVDVLYKGNSEPSPYEYKIEGDRLIIEDDRGRDVVYIKQ